MQPAPIFTGNCQHNYIRITTPASSSSSNFPAIARVCGITCNVGLQEMPKCKAVITQSANPLTSTTTFRLLLKDPSKVNLDIYNVFGKKVCRIVDGKNSTVIQNLTGTEQQRTAVYWQMAGYYSI